MNTGSLTPAFAAGPDQAPHVPSLEEEAQVIPGAVVMPLAAAGEPGSEQTLPDGDIEIRRSTLPGGVRVISQHVPATHSVGIGVWVPVGSRDETPRQAGSTHFLEHLLFKGTPTRSALDIAIAFDSVGGDSNAETRKETTTYWARVLDEDMDMAIDTLIDMVTSSKLDVADFEMERGVILDELAMSDDSPTEVVHEAFQRAVHGDNGLGRPVGGTPDAIRAVGRDDVWEHYQARYSSRDLIITAAGNVDHDHLVERVCQALKQTSWDTEGLVVPTARRPIAPAPTAPDAGEDVAKTREVEQAHVILGCPSMRAGDPGRPVMSVLLGVLGGSMSSRLFQEIREKRGLAYSTYAFDSAYTDAGAFGMYAGTSPDRVDEVERIMIAQLESLAADGPTEAELSRVAGQLRGGMALGMEDNLSRMMRLGRSEIRGLHISVEDSLARLESVTADEVRDLAVWLAGQKRTRAVVMPR